MKIGKIYYMTTIYYFRHVGIILGQEHDMPMICYSVQFVLYTKVLIA